MISLQKNSFKIMLCLSFFGLLMQPGALLGNSDHPEAPTLEQKTVIEDSSSHELHHGGNTETLTWVGILGRLHPLSIHFPIALLVVAALLECIAWATGSKLLHELSKINLYIGTLSALLAAPLGWAAAANTNPSRDLLEILEVHRWVGTATAVWACLCAWIASQSARNKQFLISYRATLLVGALLVSISGHFGGMLVFGANYFKF